MIDKNVYVKSILKLFVKMSYLNRNQLCCVYLHFLKGSSEIFILHVLKVRPIHVHWLVFVSLCLSMYTVSQKNGSLKQVGITSSKHARYERFSQNASAFHCGLISFKKLDVGRAPPARFLWQQQDHTHSRRQLFVNKQNAFY